MRETYVMRGGRLVRKRLAPPLETPHRVHVIGDVMEPVKHMGTGAVLDSKSRFRQHTRDSGCVEVGTDPAGARPRRPYEPPSLAPYVQRAIATLESR